MKRQLLILSLILLVISCKKSEKHNEKHNEKYIAQVYNTEVSEKRFESDVFSFNYPDDWSITDSEEIEEGIFYMAIEKKGFDSSGLMTIVSFEELIDLDGSIEMNIEELQSNTILKNLKFDAIKDSKFNGNTSRSSNFEFKTFGIKHEGSIYAFSNENNSIVILKQEALEDRKANKNGFDIIENSFELK